jgi:surface antigen
MRWFPESPWAEACFGSILLLAALFVATPARSQSVEASADWSATVTEAGMVDPDVEAGLSETLPVKLKLDDRVAALQAIQFTLDEVADGATYLWHRKNGELHGYVKPLDSYLDDQGRVCRRLKLALTVGEFSREVEGVACRSEDKRWMLGH